jgi:hypothetical protein
MIGWVSLLGSGRCLRSRSFLDTQTHARQQLQVHRRKFPILALCRELGEGSVQDISGGLHHLGIVVVADVQIDRHLETDRPAVDLKRDGYRPAAANRLDARATLILNLRTFVGIVDRLPKIAAPRLDQLCRLRV